MSYIEAQLHDLDEGPISGIRFKAECPKCQDLISLSMPGVTGDEMKCSCGVLWRPVIGVESDEQCPATTMSAEIAEAYEEVARAAEEQAEVFSSSAWDKLQAALEKLRKAVVVKER